MLVHMSTVTRNECTDAINAILDAIVHATDADVLSTVWPISTLSLDVGFNSHFITDVRNNARGFEKC